MLVSFLDLQLLLVVIEIAIYHFFDIIIRWVVSTLLSFLPSASRDVDRILARRKLAPLNHFFPEYHQRLYAIIDALREHLQHPQNNSQVLDAYNHILHEIHLRIPGTFPTVTVDDIRDHFIQRWPHISPLAKGSCLDVDPIGVYWGLVERGNNAPNTIWINPYLVQALKAVPEVRGGEH